jgi:hypothetical protein
MEPTYYDTAKGETISRRRAVLELRRHGIDDPSEFDAELGNRPTYKATDVLDWLGY